MNDEWVNAKKARYQARLFVLSSLVETRSHAYWA
jgi:hypothetical protein